MPAKLFCNQFLWRPNFWWPSRQLILAHDETKLTWFLVTSCLNMIAWITCLFALHELQSVSHSDSKRRFAHTWVSSSIHGKWTAVLVAFPSCGQPLLATHIFVLYSLFLFRKVSPSSGCLPLGFRVLCSLFLFRKVSPSSGCLPLSFRVPWLLFHMEHTFLSSPPASSLPSPSRNQCRAERRNKTAI